MISTSRATSCRSLHSSKFNFHFPANDCEKLIYHVKMVGGLSCKYFLVVVCHIGGSLTETWANLVELLLASSRKYQYTSAFFSRVGSNFNTSNCYLFDSGAFVYFLPNFMTVT